MGIIQKGFTGFVNIVLKLLFVLIVLISFKRLTEYWEVFNFYNLALLIFFSIPGIIIYWAIKKEINDARIITGILIYSFIIRIIWIASINSVPVSDFAGMYERSLLVLNGEFDMFKGHNYYARFPHLTMIVLYFAAIRKFFTYPLMALKIINVICSTAGVLLSYLIAKEVFNSKVKGILAGYIAAVYPPMIVYTAVYCGENMAIPFYLMSVYFFILVIKDKKPLGYLILSGLSLTIGNFFRMVAPVMIVAYLICLLIYFQTSLRRKIISCVYILGAFIIPLVIVSTFLRTAGITEFNLWKGSESSWTSILKGTNPKSYGRWNEEDAKIVDKYNDDYEKVEQASKEIVKERLTTTPLMDLIKFYNRKYTYQWREGDFGGVFWAKLGIEEKDLKADPENMASTYIQFVYFMLIILTYIGLFNKKLHLKNPEINLFYIIYCGYALLFLITESQDRYSFIASWLFIILPLTIFDGKKIFLLNVNLETIKVFRQKFRGMVPVKNEN